MFHQMFIKNMICTDSNIDGTVIMLGDDDKRVEYHIRFRLEDDQYATVYDLTLEPLRMSYNKEVSENYGRFLNIPGISIGFGMFQELFRYS